MKVRELATARDGNGATGGGPPVRRVVIVDDHRSFAEALAIAIDAEPDLTCVAIAGTAAAGLATAQQVRPDLVVVDMQLPDLPGPALVRKLHESLPGTRALAFTAYADAASVAAAAAAGVCAFLRKECSLRDLVTTLRTAGSGPMAIDADTLSAMVSTTHRPPAPAPVVDRAGVHLTPREAEVLGLLDRGCDAQGIARRLGISIHTTRGYVKTLLSKLDAHTQLEAVANARRHGLLAGAGVSGDTVVTLPELHGVSASAV